MSWSNTVLVPLSPIILLIQCGVLLSKSRSSRLTLEQERVLTPSSTLCATPLGAVIAATRCEWRDLPATRNDKTRHFSVVKSIFEVPRTGGGLDWQRYFGFSRRWSRGKFRAVCKRATNNFSFPIGKRLWPSVLWASPTWQGQAYLEIRCRLQAVVQLCVTV